MALNKTKASEDAAWNTAWKGSPLEAIMTRKPMEPERTPEKEAEVLRRFEALLSDWNKCSDCDYDEALKELAIIRQEEYKPKPLEIWAAISEGGRCLWAVNYDPALCVYKDANGTAYELRRFREVIESDS